MTLAEAAPRDPRTLVESAVPGGRPVWAWCRTDSGSGAETDPDPECDPAVPVLGPA